MISAEHLSKSFGRSLALDDVSFVVPRNAVYALIGANGAGKSTLIKLLMNILAPTAGLVRVLDIAPFEVQGKQLSRIGYVSENQELPEGMTVGAMLRYLRPFYPQWDRALEARLVQQFELPLKRKLKHLSRGMRMKAAFVGSLAYRPEVIVMDEPLSGLDPLVRDELIEALRELKREGVGTTILLSSHDLAEIESFASHVGFIDKGRLLFSEEMVRLKERYRQVTFSVNGLVELPKAMPKAWLRAETRDGVVSLVHSDYRGEASLLEVRENFTEAGEIAVSPLPLRSIFVAVAKGSRARTGSAIERGVA